MAANRTRPPATSVASLIAVEGEARQRDCLELIAMMQAITGFPPAICGTSIVGFGAYRYMYASGREGLAPLTGFSPRKQDLVLYLGPGLENATLRAALGKHRVGKGCLYLRRLDDVDRPALRALVAHAVAVMRQRHQPG